MTNVLLKAGNAISAQHKPKLERSKSSRQRNSPVTIINGCVGVAVLEIKRIDDQCRRQADSIAHPQSGAIEVDQQPFVGIRIEGVCVLDALINNDVS